jgi:exoribonuclease-2
MSAMSTPQAGCIVEFLQNNQPVIAWVLEIQGARLRLFTASQREMKLPISRVLPWIGPQYSTGASRQEILDHLLTHHGQRERIADSVDTLEIWELAQGEVEEAEIDWFASLIGESDDADQRAGLGRKLLQTKTHFRFTPPKFEIYSLDIVERRQEELRKAKERERLVGFGQDFLRALWERFCKRKQSLPETNPEQEERLRDLLMTRITSPDDRDSEALWKVMSQGLPEDPFLPLYLAQAWGIVTQHFNVHLARAGYAWSSQWAEKHTEAISTIKATVLSRAAEPIFKIMTIDAASTQDLDDGFSLEKTNTGYLLHQALACPALGWEFDSALDRDVQHRYTSLYLPEGTSHMLPQELGTGFFSLAKGQKRPALVITFDLDEQARLRSCSPQVAWVHINTNWTFTEVKEDLASDKTTLLTHAHTLAMLLRQQRVAADHAVIMEQPDPQIVLQGDLTQPTVHIVQPKPTPKAQMIVSEFMILANKTMAAWALEHDVPLLFRTQNITLPAENAGVWSDPTDIYRLINTMGPSILECEPKRHATLGATAYAPVTSPLRRYSDFINMAQIIGKLTGQGRLLDKNTLENLLPVLSARAEATGQVQRLRLRYWKYEYFRQNSKKMRWSGIIVDPGSMLTTIALPDVQLFLKAPRKIFGDKVRVGQRFAIRIGRVDPLAGEIKIIEAWEEE